MSLTVIIVMMQVTMHEILSKIKQDIESSENEDFYHSENDNYVNSDVSSNND